MIDKILYGLDRILTRNMKRYDIFRDFRNTFERDFKVNDENYPKIDQNDSDI